MPPGLGMRTRILVPSVLVGSATLSEPARRIRTRRGTWPSSFPKGGGATWASEGGAAGAGSSMPYLVYMRNKVAGLQGGSETRGRVTKHKRTRLMHAQGTSNWSLRIVRGISGEGAAIVRLTEHPQRHGSYT